MKGQSLPNRLSMIHLKSVEQKHLFRLTNDRHICDTRKSIEVQTLTNVELASFVERALRHSFDISILTSM